MPCADGHVRLLAVRRRNEFFRRTSDFFIRSDLKVALAWERTQLDDNSAMELLPISANALDLDAIRLGIESI